jgi:hypothetical protein
LVKYPSGGNGGYGSNGDDDDDDSGKTYTRGGKEYVFVGSRA